MSPHGQKSPAPKPAPPKGGAPEKKKKAAKAKAPARAAPKMPLNLPEVYTLVYANRVAWIALNTKERRILQRGETMQLTPAQHGK